MTAAPPASSLRYALVTPARNEAAFIELTLESVAAQTTLPVRWVVVSDGSNDGTDEIVRQYAQRYPWIELLRLESGAGRDFARKVHAFNAGHQRLRHVPHDLIGSLDADVSFAGTLFAHLLERFADMPDLGVAGPAVDEAGVRYDYRFTNIDDVSGACQLFRRECFEEIGGYVAVESGGIDSIAVTTARMKGWRTRTFDEQLTVHHRKRGSVGRRRWEPGFRQGEKDYALGGHPLWQVARSVYQATSRPYVLGGLMLLSGYAYRMAKRSPPPVSDELIRFRRAEQMFRLKRAARNLLPFGSRLYRDDERGTPSLTESLARLERWIEAQDYKGYEPFDGLSSAYLRPLTFGNPRLEQLLLQVGRQSPVNLRPLLAVKPLESTKGRGYMAWGYLAALRRTGRQAYRQRAIDCLEWLIRNKSPLYPEYSWGNHFDYASRAGRYGKHESTIVWTSLIGQAFVDGYEILGDERYLDVARSICDWIVTLPREGSSSGVCLSYLAARQLSLHNSNLLGAAMLARTAKHTGSSALLELAAAAAEYSCSRQLSDGAWYYGEDPIYHWIDNFHTGFNLDSLKCYIDSTGDQRFRPHLDRGYQYYRTHFVEPDGRPKYYHDRVYPIDIQAAAQTIETLAKFAEHDPGALGSAVTIARWTIRNMQDARGYFYYRRLPFLVSRIPMLHWGQATMYRALALLLLKLGEQRPASGSAEQRAPARDPIAPA